MPQLTACCTLPCLQTTFLVQRPVGMRMLVQALATEKPTPSCMVCGTAQLQLQINTISTTLAQFINKVGSVRIWLGELPLARDMGRLPTALLDSMSCSCGHLAVLPFGSAAECSSRC